MKITDIKPFSQLPLRFFPEGFHFHLTDFVRQGLAGPDDVAVHFDFDVVIGLRRVVQKKSIACCRVQPIACIPVSTTSRTARHAS